MQTRVQLDWADSHTEPSAACRLCLQADWAGFGTLEGEQNRWVNKPSKAREYNKGCRRAIIYCFHRRFLFCGRLCSSCNNHIIDRGESVFGAVQTAAESINHETENGQRWQRRTRLVSEASRMIT